jgi:hypothetical protein
MRAFALLLLAAVPALADDAGLLRCRAIPESAARLACYDALVVPASAPAASTFGLPAAPAPAQPVPAPKPEQFGMEFKTPDNLPEAIESTIPGVFDGWGPKENIRLANGQVWQVTDDSSGVVRTMKDGKVRVRRGVLGAFYLEIEGSNRSPRVKRLQ